MSRMQRILMTLDAVGGVWSYALQLARRFADRGLEVLLCCMGPEPSESQLADFACMARCHLVHAPYQLEWMEDPWKEVDEAGSWLQMCAEEFAPDVIHLNGFVHASLPWQAPVVVAAHSCLLTWWRAVKGDAAPLRY